MQQRHPIIYRVSKNLKIQNRQEPPITDKMNEKKASDEISLKELLEKGKEWYGYLLSQ
jgi:hypothetical protein